MMYAVALSSPWAVAGVVVAVVVAAASVAMFFTIPLVVFNFTMYRSPRKKRTRECTNKKDESQMRMFAEGIEWAGQFKDKTEELHIVNDGLNLYGEYINLGYDKCAVILQGRTESLLYSYYFADVYAKNGHNILAIDVRAHGLSDGVCQSAGIKESDDLVLWIKLIRDRYSIQDFTLHGVCIGGATAVYTYIKLKDTGLIKRLVTDGLFTTFYEIFRRHVKKYKGIEFPFTHMVFFIVYMFTGARLIKETPIKYMPDIDIPFLFIWSEEDIFTVKEKSLELFEACASKHKELSFFPKGRHSHVRASQPEAFDKAVDEFLKKYQEERLCVVKDAGM